MTPLRFPKFVAATLGFLLTFTLAFAAPVKFDIPAQPAPAALKVFTKQSSVQVVFNTDELQSVKTGAVQGTFEPPAALDLLLKDTGFSAKEKSKGMFVIKAVAGKQMATGMVRGSLVKEDLKPAEGVRVIIRETGQGASTDKNGEFFFSGIEPGTYLLVAQATGYQPLHITGVIVKGGSELTLSRERLRVADETMKLEPYVVTAEAVLELDPYGVTGIKQKPFEGANVDIPRTIDDAQPRYIFDAKTIDQSGATNVEDFLKQRLTMNAAMQMSADVAGTPNNPNITGNISAINLRGLGTDKTLVLVNGRRQAGTGYTAGAQPDLNGIPLNAIDRIEILPSSASGIYGGSAIGGVVNVILKRNFAGGEVRAVYDNMFDVDSPRRKLSAMYGLTMEGGRTHFLITAHWSDAKPFLLVDRRELFDRGLALILKNNPAQILGTTNPFLGQLPNITLQSSSGNLTLKPAFGGGSIGSRNTYVPAGTTGSTTSPALGAALLANAGKWDMNLPPTTQSPTGLLRPFGLTPQTKSFIATLRRQMGTNLEAFVEFSLNENRSTSVYNPYNSFFAVPTSAPTNPFTATVRVRVPNVVNVPLNTEYRSPALTVGFLLHLPYNWIGELDYTRSETRHNSRFYLSDTTAVTTQLNNGTLNPFVDTLLTPLLLDQYLAPVSSDNLSRLNDFALRGSGPLWKFSWGAPQLTLGIEHRTAVNPESQIDYVFPITTTGSNRVTYFKRTQATDSLYAETEIPLVAAGRFPLVHAVDLQLSGRGERYTVDTGTPSRYFYYNQVPPLTGYDAPTLNGQPFFSNANYTSTNATIGLKYQPVPTLTLRASYATAFLPPTPEQLLKNPVADNFTTTITDPKNPTVGTDFGDGKHYYDIGTISGGNPNLRPQHSKSFNAGAIWEPQLTGSKSLRIGIEYYKIEQFDAISSLDAQTVINLESSLPGRVTRDSSSLISLVDTSSLNLFRSATTGIDLNLACGWKTAVGTFDFRLAESLILHLKNQYLATLPLTDAVNFPAEGGAAKYKTNASLVWESRHWTLGWTTRYFGSYLQRGAVGGPSSVQFANGAVAGGLVAAQGSDTIPAQTYHDFLVGFDFGREKPATSPKALGARARLFDGLTVQVNVTNVLGANPPVDVAFASNFYVSPYGDTRLRSYQLSLKKAF